MNTMTSPSASQIAAYLRTLPSIRERCTAVHALGQQGQLQYFDYAPENEKQVIKFCLDIIQRDYGSDLQSILPHGRWRHFDVGHSRTGGLIAQWAKDSSEIEVAKRLIDLCLVSVLLDAGAGNTWSYREKGTGEIYSRSEGLAIASLDMFKDGMFSGDAARPYQVDAEGLSRLTTESVSSAMQVNASNLMTGIEGRASLLSNLAEALRSNKSFFGSDARPGNLLDFLHSNSIPSTSPGHTTRIHISTLWAVIIEGLAPIWPARMQLGGVSLGDVWPCPALAKSSATSEPTLGQDLVPFHKLSQWLTYSLVEPIERIMKWEVEGMEDMTGLPEYRNGGLLVDFGVLSLRPGVLPQSFYLSSDSSIPRLPPSHPAIIEWRAMTVIELDRIAAAIRNELNYPTMSLGQVLESATWKGGREIAKQKRPETGGPPIDIESDGTVF